MLTTQVEPWHPFIEEVRPLLDRHWEELALNKDKVPLSPQWHVYEERASKGQVMVVTLRTSGAIVGYFIGFVAPGLHYQTCLTLTMDIWWTKPEVRGGTAGLRLMRAVLKEAKRRGVQRAVMGSKNHRDSSRFFKAMGFEPIETYHSKWIGD